MLGKGRICYKDVLALHCTNHNEYGDDIVYQSVEVPAIVQENYGWTRGGFQENITSTTVAWIDPAHNFVKGNCYRIEGMLVSFNKYCDDTRHIWYRVEGVDIIRDHLRCNDIRHIELSLTKVEEPRWWCEKVGDGDDHSTCQEEVLPEPDPCDPEPELDECDPVVETEPEPVCKDWCDINLDRPEDRPMFDAYGTPIAYNPKCNCNG